MAQTEWEWPMTDSQKSHSERAALLRPILYEMTTPVESPGFVDPQWESALPEHQQWRDAGLDGSSPSDRTSDEGLCADADQHGRNSNPS